MITSMHIENFKCFKEFDIELGPFNVLIGPNDTGKTAFLQAVRLAGAFPPNSSMNVAMGPVLPEAGFDLAGAFWQGMTDRPIRLLAGTDQHQEMVERFKLEITCKVPPESNKAVAIWSSSLRIGSSDIESLASPPISQGVPSGVLESFATYLCDTAYYSLDPRHCGSHASMQPFCRKQGRDSRRYWRVSCARTASVSLLWRSTSTEDFRVILDLSFPWPRFSAEQTA